MRNYYSRKRASTYRFADMVNSVFSVRTEQQVKMLLQDFESFSKSMDKKNLEVFSNFIEDSDFLYQTIYKLDRVLVSMYQKNQELQKKRPTDKRITNTGGYNNLTILFSKVEKTIMQVITNIRPFFKELGLMLKNLTHYNLVSDGYSMIRAIVDFQKKMETVMYNLDYVFQFMGELADGITSENTMFANEEIDSGLGGWFRRKFMKSGALTLKDQLTEELAEIVPSLESLYVLKADASQISRGMETYMQYLTCEASFRQLLNMRVPTEDSKVWDTEIKTVLLQYAKFFSQSKYGNLNLKSVATDLSFMTTVKSKAKDFVSEMKEVVGI